MQNSWRSLATTISWRPVRRVGALVTLLLCSAPSSAVNVQIRSVGPMSPRNQAAWWSPIASRNDVDYVSYLAANSPQDDVFLARRSSAGGAWSTADTGVNALYNVGHTQTSMAIDGQGYLHVAYAMHNNSMRILTSNQPNSIEAGYTPLAGAGLAPFSGGAYTYPNMTTAPNGDVYLIVRDQRSSYANQQGRLFRFNNTSRAWGELPAFAGQSGTTVYPDQIITDASGDLHILWEWAAGGAQAARHYGSYARFDPDTNTYYRANGTPYPAGPIAVGAADIYQGLEGTETFTANLHGVQSAKLTLDEAGRPLIAYSYSTTGTDSGYQHRFARWTGSDWVRSVITPGPFDLDKPWLAYSQGVLRYYGTVPSSDPLHVGTDDLFARTSWDLGQSWSAPFAITQGLDIQRPVGISSGTTDRLYLPSISGGALYVAQVTWEDSLPQPQESFPYFNSFTGPGLTYQSGGFASKGENGHLSCSANNGVLVDTTTVSLPNVGESDFLLSTRLVLDNVAGSGNVITVGFGAFGSASNFSSAEGQSFYLADWAVNPTTSQGQLRILALGDSSDFTTTTGDSDGASANGSSVVLGREYELRLEGTYTDSTLNLKLSLFDAQGNAIGASATAFDGTPLAGQYFGYRNRIAGASHQVGLRYDQFSFTARPELLGDFTRDGQVDAADYVAWRDSLGTHVANGTAADGNLNGVIDSGDYLVWRSHFGQSNANSANAGQPVPEPATCYTLGLLIAYVTCLRARCARCSRPRLRTLEPCLSEGASFARN